MAPQPLTHIRIAGFKSFRDEQEIEIRPLTVLAGENSSGKSSAVQPLLLLKQTLEAPYEPPGPLLLDGPNVRFSSAEQLLWKGPGAGGSAAELRFGLGRPRTTDVHPPPEDIFACTVVFQRGTRGLRLVRLEYRNERGLQTLREDSTQDQLDALLPGLGGSSHEPAARRDDPTQNPWVVERARFALQVSVGGYDDSVVLEPMEKFLPAIGGLVHVPGLRGHPERSYPATGVGPAFPGPFPPYTASLIARWRDRKDARLARLEECLQGLGLSRTLDCKVVEETRVELRVGRLPAAAPSGPEDLINIADVGFGVSQVLPVLVALLAAEPGQLVYVEQPEIHLHPRAQVALAVCLVEAAKRGVLVIAETHSHLVLQGIQHAVASGVDPRLVKLHWFKRDEDGATSIASADLDERGAFGDWPVDFGEVELQSEDRYLRAALK